jgi:hypothetical protein
MDPFKAVATLQASGDFSSNARTSLNTTLNQVITCKKKPCSNQFLPLQQL